jgi:hypothetical protein
MKDNRLTQIERCGVGAGRWGIGQWVGNGLRGRIIKFDNRRGRRGLGNPKGSGFAIANRNLSRRWGKIKKARWGDERRHGNDR